MRRRSLLLAVPAGLLTLSACGDEKSDQDKDRVAESPSAPEPGASAKIVDGPLPAITGGVKFGEKPTVAKGSGKPSADLAVKTVIAGSGAAIAEGDYVRAHYLGQIWDTAKVFDNSYDRKQPLVIQLQQGAIIDGWRLGLAGRKAGSRVEMAVPPALGYGSQGRDGIKGTDTMVFVIDVEETFNGRSSVKGKEVPQDDAALPKVGTNTDGKAPAITVPKAAAPKKLVAKYVLEGDGEEVRPTDKLLLQYKGVLWDGGKEFDSSYSRQELAAFSLQQLIKGWQEGLAGKKVGSRVMLVVPPDKGYGGQASEKIPANSTLVFTLDILAKV
ncbi:FKBP-type peptidyl-prolyl cis-trans isomerase [Streptomyces somaliensis DSM 40738]|uniref:peptidylprolyl isomerase n=1 Tax=Streptomyces somaliensis (strain ATCC 33201 / DSM 40738 / JCM 12659 / KCTC 9044 / NCTC 11332 / NRRL B-12077 / IP 733) TaxID=1134445 RepID=A0AA44DDB4_STRE0|nr:FKBP-type peptidyl-prolyl cis-trans isomerase [Streptomyces somaliensis]MCQ0022065.1 FKBP-type peptidyl-prolyl cis-trans isomerase [Streptomyces somaliensis DSM 40738]NKY14791.1 FKBP-type peptidyl-prolyl cis-trans isomerase [Streptomyces somaliensis DSM 40738]